MKLVTLEYLEVNREPKIVFFTREGRARQRTVVSNFRPYFFVPASSGEAGEVYEALDGKKVVKIYTTLPGEVKDLRASYPETYEADVHFTTRYLIDEVPRIEKAELRIQYTDIETDLETNQVISIAVYDNYLDKVVAFTWREGAKTEKISRVYNFPSGFQFRASIHQYSSRNAMLLEYIRFIQETDPDILTGWFFVGYDMPQLIRQINSVQIAGRNIGAHLLSPLGKCYFKQEQRYEEDKVVCAGRVLWDMLRAYKKLQPTDLPDRSLEAVALRELGEGKKPLEKSIGWLWRNDLETLIEYNCKDAVLVYRIDKKCRILDYFDSLRRWIGCEWDTLFKPSLAWDVKILKTVHNKVVLPSKKEVAIGDVEGALVFEPVLKGIHNWIVLLDLKSLYPSIIMTFNMSPETVVRDSGSPGESLYRLGNGVAFRSQPTGLLPSILMKMVEERKKYLEEMKKYPVGSSEYDVYDHLQTGVKVLMNALYGSTLLKKFRLASREVGSSVTFMGRTVLRRVRAKLEGEGFKILYGDTDSIFYFSKKNTLPEVITEMKELAEAINRDLEKFTRELGGKDNYIRIEPKKIYSKFLIAEKKTKKGVRAKKRYAGRVVWAGEECDELDVMGFEARRSNTSELTRELQRNILKTLFGFEPPENQKVYIQEAIHRLHGAEVDWDYVGIPQGLGKPLDEYDSESPWVRGAKYANKYLGENFEAGDKPKMCYIKAVPRGYPKTDAVCFRHTLPEGFIMDAEKMFEKSVKEKLQQLFDAAGVNVEQALGGQSLDWWVPK